MSKYKKCPKCLNGEEFLAVIGGRSVYADLIHGPKTIECACGFRVDVPKNSGSDLPGVWNNAVDAQLERNQFQ